MHLPNAMSVVRGSLLSLLFAALTSSAPLALLTPTASVRPLHLFPNGTAAENLYVIDDGSVLVTVLYPSAALYYFPTANSSDPALVYNFTDSASAYGITEYEDDIFAVCSGTFDRSGNVTDATGIIWRVDMTNFAISANGTVTSPANVTVMANLTSIGFLNGAETLNDDIVLAADSVKGVVYAIDTQRGNYSVVLNDTSLSPNATGPVRLGVNGLRIVNDTLYFTNTNKRSVGKVQINSNGTAAGPYITVASNVLVDDLDVDPVTGAIYISSLVENAITLVSPNGTVSVLAGSLNSTEVPGPTSIRFTRGLDEVMGGHRGLLISTSGGFEYPINGTYIVGGGLYELDVSGVSPSR